MTQPTTRWPRCLACCAPSCSAVALTVGADVVREDVGRRPSWCGSKKIKLGFTDGFGGNSWRLVTTASARDEATKCPSVTSLDYADGQGNTQKAISDIQGMVAKGVNALVVFPDAGKAILPALRSAYKAGVVTVPYRVTPGGKAGVDYNVFIDTAFPAGGENWGKWILKVPAEGRQRAHPQRPEGQQPGRRGEQGPARGPRPVGQVQVHRRAAVRGDELGSRR